jgi:hypothetical protein
MFTNKTFPLSTGKFTAFPPQRSGESSHFPFFLTRRFFSLFPTLPAIACVATSSRVDRLNFHCPIFRYF